MDRYDDTLDDQLDTSIFNDAPDDPIALLQVWLDRARKLQVREPGALALATTGPDAHASNRIVQVLDIRGDALVFATHAQSGLGLGCAVLARNAAAGDPVRLDCADLGRRIRCPVGQALIRHSSDVQRLTSERDIGGRGGAASGSTASGESGYPATQAGELDRLCTASFGYRILAGRAGQAAWPPALRRDAIRMEHPQTSPVASAPATTAATAARPAIAAACSDPPDDG
jgi:hypothetical protein